MKVQIKVMNLGGLLKGLSSLSAQHLRGKTSFKVLRNSKIIFDEHKTFVEARTNLLKSLAVKDEKGEPVWLDEEKGILKFDNITEVEKAIVDLESEEVELNLAKFEVDELDDVLVSAQELHFLQILIKEEE